MKRILAVMAVLALALSLAGAVRAEGKTIRPLPVLTDISRLGDRFVTTDIEPAGGNRVTLKLFEKERFDGEDIRALQVGDVIVTDGEEVKVESITVDADVWVNKGRNTELRLCENSFGEFERVMENDMVPWIALGSFETELNEYTLFLDWVNPETGEGLDAPAVRDAAFLLRDLPNTETVGYDCKAVKIIYDSSNQPYAIWRFYSPAQ